MIAAHHAGGAFYGRMYRDEYEFREFYRRRAGVGGLFGSILNSSEFDLFLSLLLFLICVNVLRDHIRSAPVISIAILAMVGLHFEIFIFGVGNTFINADNFHKYSFHPNRILNDGQWYRLLTGPFLHSGRKLHLYLNMTALATLCYFETSSTWSSWCFLLFFLGLTMVTGIMYIVFCREFKRSDLNSFTSGFTGVIFALKTYSNTYHSGSSFLGFPLVGDLFTYSIPVEVPRCVEHFVEVLLVTLIFQDDVPFWWNAGGIAAGYIFVVAVEILTHSSAEKGSSVRGPFPEELGEATSLSDSIKSALTQAAVVLKENGSTLAVLLVIIILIKVMMDKRELQYHLQEMQRHAKENNHVERPEQSEAPNEATESEPQPLVEEQKQYKTERGSMESELKQQAHGLELEEDTQEQFKGEKAGSKAVPSEVGSIANQSAVSGEGVSVDLDSWTWEEGSAVEINSMAEASTAKGNDINGPPEDTVDENSMLSSGLPEAFTMALNLVTTVTESQTQEKIIVTLKTLITLITNATTKGQQIGDEKSTKYRHIRISNPRIQECNIKGVFQLMEAVGFEVKEDFYDEKFLVYPCQETPNWLPEALVTMKQKIDEIVHPSHPVGADKHDYKRRAKLAALKRQAEAASKRKPRVARQSGYSAGLGGGNSQSVFYQGGT